MKGSNILQYFHIKIKQHVQKVLVSRKVIFFSSTTQTQTAQGNEEAAKIKAVCVQVNFLGLSIWHFSQPLL